MTEKSEWLSLGEAAAMLGMSNRSLVRRIQDEKILAAWMDGFWRLRRKDVEEYIEQKFREGAMRQKSSSAATI